MTDLYVKTWYKYLPPITKLWFELILLIQLLSFCGFCQPKHLYLDWRLIVEDFQIWRLITSFLYLPFSFRLLFQFYTIYKVSVRLESGVFRYKTGDYLFLLIFCGILSIIFGIAVDMPFLFDTIMFSITYIWCSLNYEAYVPTFAGFQCKVSRLIWYLLLGNLLLFYTVVGEIVGIMIGWIYYYFKFQFAKRYQKKVFPNAPNFLNNFFNQSKYV